MTRSQSTEQPAAAKRPASKSAGTAPSKASVSTPGPCAQHAVCGRPAEPHLEGRCILHATNPQKSRRAFSQAFAEHRAKRSGDFSYVVFPGDTSFRGEAFDEAVSFRGARFTGEVDFAGARFRDDVSFQGTVFQGGVDGAGAVFRRQAAFSDARFEGDVDFSGAHFGGAVHFTGAAFEDWASFVEATFGDTVTLHQVHFGGPVTFYECLFKGDVLFSGGAASQTLAISRARFEKRATFSGVRFGERFDLSQATFEDETVFEGRGQPLFENAEVNFRDASFGYYAVVFIRNADLRRCLFLDTDLRNVEFTSVQWPVATRGACVYDEVFSRQRPDVPMPWGQLARLYRELKQNYEDRRNYLRSGDFHYREKEMQRRNPAMPWNHRTLLWVYWALSGYGERVLPPLAWLLGLILGGAVLYLGLGVRLTAAGAPLTWQSADIWMTVYYSLRVSLLQPPDNLVLSPLAQGIHTVQLVLSPVLIGLLALAIRQRVKR